MLRKIVRSTVTALFDERSNEVRRESVDSCDGIVPLSKLFDRSSELSSDSTDNTDGIVPTRHHPDTLR